MEIDPDSVERIQDYLSVIAPEVQGFNVVSYGDFETVQFKMRGSAVSGPVVFDASSTSDGTLRVLASLVAAYQIHLPAGPDVVGIEEPETALHPAAMQALVGALDEATLRTQIILTTHSGELLDAPQVTPKNLRIVEMIDGQTVIASIDKASQEIVHRQLNTLGGLERENRLELDQDDVERQKHLDYNGQEVPT